MAILNTTKPLLLQLTYDIPLQLYSSASYNLMDIYCNEQKLEQQAKPDSYNIT